MAEILETGEGGKKLNDLLYDCFIDKISYYITGWELRFSGLDHECILSASEIKIPSVDTWGNQLLEELSKTVGLAEGQDSLVAAVVFGLVNMSRVVSARLSVDGHLLLVFDNDRSLLSVGDVEHVDWTWQVRCEKERRLFTCDSGKVYESFL